MAVQIPLTAKEFAAQVGVSASTVRRIIKELKIEHAEMDYKSVRGGKPEWVTKTRLFTEESLRPVHEKLRSNRAKLEHCRWEWGQRRKIRRGRLPSWYERIGDVL